MRWALALALLLIGFPSVGGAAQPADANLLAYRDVLRLNPEERVYTRYLWVSDLDVKTKWSRFIAVSGHLQALSGRARIVPPTFILADGSVLDWPGFVGPLDWSQVTLFRINLQYYRIDPRLWDRLGDPTLEPLFHVFTLVPYPAGQYTDGSWYKAGEEKVIALAPWLFQPLPLLAPDAIYTTAAIGLAVETRATTPILEASNFIWQTAIQFNRKAGYYDFVGIKTLEDLYRVAGFDKKQSLAFSRPLLEAVADSGVAQEPRRIEVYEKIKGRIIFTLDQVNQPGIGDRNPLNVLGRNDLKADATEVFYMKSNGFWGVALFNLIDGTRQDSVPDGIGFFHQSLTNDGKDHIYLSCLTCHDKEAGNGGLKPFRPFFRNKYARPGPSALSAQTLKDLIRLSDEYLRPMDFSAEQVTYTNAVLEATGARPHEFARSLYDAFYAWDRHVSLEIAAERSGVSKEVLVAALQRQLHTFGTLDNVNDEWIHAPQRRSKIGVWQWAEAYNFQQLALRGLPTWPKYMRVKYPVR